VRLHLSGVVLVTVALLAPAIPATGASAAPTIFVDHEVTCSDTAATRGTLALPFCTIQAAIDVASPGQTVQIDPTEHAADFFDVYRENLTFTHSGSPGAPITVSGGGSGNPAGGARIFIAGPDAISARQAVRFTGVHDVTVDGVDKEAAPASAVTIANSSDITLSHDFISSPVAPPATDPVIDISGASDHVTLTEDSLSALTTAVGIGAGVSNAIVTDDYIFMGAATPAPNSAGVSVTGAANAVVTNDTVATFHDSGCVTGVRVTSSTGTSVQNNIFKAGCPSVPLVSVAADSAADTVVDYNIVHTDTPDPQLYSWAGNAFPTPATFAAATGQGAHDVDGDPQLNNAGTPAATIAADSANPGAPDAPSTDIAGSARVDDPLAPNTLGGVLDRGAIEMHDPITAKLTLSTFTAPVGGTVRATISTTSPWAPVTALTLDFGDGTTASLSPGDPVADHVYTKVGRYVLTATARDALDTVASGGTGPVSTLDSDVNIVPSGPAVVAVSTSGRGASGVLVDVSRSTGTWSFVSGTCDWGDGTAPVPETGSECQHTYAKVGTYTITVTLHDAGGNDTTGTATFTTTGARFTALSPTRLLDTRHGTGTGGKIAKVPSGGTLKLKVAGVGSIPSGTRAVALNVTVTNPATGGDVVAYADGAERPEVSNVNFVAGQTVANLTIVQVGADGDVDLSVVGGPVDLVADATGYFTANPAADGYTTLTSHRLLDTRNGTGTNGTIAPIAAHGTTSLTVAGAGGVPADGVTAVALNVTVTGPTLGGFVAVFPDGIAMPNTSSSNFVAGQTVANLVIVPVGADGKVDLTNSSDGRTNLVADVVGYFRTAGGSTYVPLAPSRFLDTRTSSGPVKSRTAVEVFTPVPDLSGGAVVNMTVTGAQQGGYVLVGPSPLPAGLISTASTLNWDHPGQTIANLAIPSSSGSPPMLSIYNGSAGTTNVIGDVLGYFDATTSQP
jgi:PKD repeat protein